MESTPSAPAEYHLDFGDALLSVQTGPTAGHGPASMLSQPLCCQLDYLQTNFKLAGPAKTWLEPSHSHQQKTF